MRGYYAIILLSSLHLLACIHNMCIPRLLNLVWCSSFCLIFKCYTYSCRSLCDSNDYNIFERPVYVVRYFAMCVDIFSARIYMNFKMCSDHLLCINPIIFLYLYYM